MPPTVAFTKRERSGLQRANRSGLGFPATSLAPLTIMKETAIARPNPIQPVFHSQSLRRHDAPLESVEFWDPKGMSRLPTKTMPAGMMSPITTSTGVVMVSLVSGKDRSGSVKSNALRWGVTWEKPAPTAAMPLDHDQLILDPPKPRFWEERPTL